MVQGQAGEVLTATRKELLVLVTLPGWREGEDTLDMAGWALSRCWVCNPPPAPMFLFCLGAGVPVQLLESTGHLQILSEGQVLQIQPASVSDSGHYTCVATNAVGEDNRDFIVHVQGEPWAASQCPEQWVSWQEEGSLVGPLGEQSMKSIRMCWKTNISLASLRPGQMLWLHLGVKVPVPHS